VQDFAPDLVLGDVVYACAMGQSELLGRAQGRSPPRLPRVLVRCPAPGHAHSAQGGWRRRAGRPPPPAWWPESVPVPTEVVL